MAVNAELSAGTPCDKWAILVPTSSFLEEEDPLAGTGLGEQAMF